MRRIPSRVSTALVCLMAMLLLSACPGQDGSDQSQDGRVSPAAGTDNGLQTAASAPEDTQAAVPLPHKTIAVVLGASETDEWTAVMLTALAAQTGIDPLSQGRSQGGLDIFGPHEGQLSGRAVTVHLALCDLNSVADLATQRKLGELAQDWIEEIKPDAVWLDGDQLQLHCGSTLDPQLPIVFSGVEVRLDAFYEEGRAVCGVLRQHSLARAIAVLLEEQPGAKNIALVSDDSPLGLSRIADVRALESALPYGVKFVTQEPVTSWDGLGMLLRGLDSGIEAVLIAGLGGSGGSLASAGAAPAALMRGVSQPVLAYGPSPLDASGVISLRVKPALHAREALGLLAQVLAGKSAASLGNSIPSDMALFRSER